MLQALRKSLRQNKILRRLAGHYLAPSGFFDQVLLGMNVSAEWKKRINEVAACPDNKFIPRVPEAGRIHRGKQTMHNGIKVNLGSYYGIEVAKMLQINKGVHEPQEERIFKEVLTMIPPGSTMIEMGAFWAFYSMWFYSKVNQAKCYMIEPDPFNLESGKRNFSLNKMTGKFYQGFIGEKSGITPEREDIICIDDFVQKENINYIHLLHSDIQGFELEMLKGAKYTLLNKKAEYIFISTHSNEVHYACIDFLKDFNYHIMASIDKTQTYSEDGLIVAHSKGDLDKEMFEVSRRATGMVEV